eukprot:NODE_13_length_42895_cov_0.518413.p10 type:complete len:449 gc:universal NODE_13_length_42895_cov_0.518413:6402-7748(+)
MDQSTYILPDPLGRLRRVVDQEFNLETLLIHKDLFELNQLEDRVQYLLDESSKPNASPISVVTHSPTINNRRPSSAVIFQDTNGKYLLLSCNICARTNFTDVQGLINHCRSAHSITISTTRQAISECANVLDFVPEGAEVHQLQFATTLPSNSNNESRVQSPQQADDGRMKRGAIELPSLKLKIANTSLFFIKKKILIGNINQFITPDKRALNYEKCAYRWLIYVKTKHPVDITTFVKKVRFFLHGTYKPNEVVDINRPPFYITRLGWGEFIARIQIYFHDSRNQPIDIPYHLKLDQQTTGKELLGDERQYELHLDQNTVFNDPVPFKGSDKVNQVLSSEAIAQIMDSPVLSSPVAVIPNQSNCFACGGHCNCTVPTHLYPAVAEEFQYLDAKTTQLLRNTSNVVPSNSIRTPTVVVDLNEIKDIAMRMTSNSIHDGAIVLLAAVISY